MTVTLTGATLATALAASLSGAVLADTLQPMRAGTFTLNEWAASVYYTDRGGSYEVVVTLAALQGDERVPIRLTAALEPGQSKTVEIGSFEMNEDPASLKIEREGDELSATLAPTSTAISAPAIQ